MILIIVWISFGLFHWLDYVFNYASKGVCVLDITLLPIVFILFGPITTVRKYVL